MPTYRAYLTDADGRFQSVRILSDRRDDTEAIRAAEPLVDGFDVQIWDLDRQVATPSMVGGQVVCRLGRRVGRARARGNELSISRSDQPALFYRAMGASRAVPRSKAKGCNLPSRLPVDAEVASYPERKGPRRKRWRRQ